MYLITIPTLSLRHLGPGSSLRPRSTSGRQSRSEPPLVPGAGGLAQASSGRPMRSSSTIGRGSGCGSDGVPTFIRTPTHGSIRLDRGWRFIIDDGNSGIVSRAEEEGGPKIHLFPCRLQQESSSHFENSWRSGEIELMSKLQKG